MSERWMECKDTKKCPIAKDDLPWLCPHKKPHIEMTSCKIAVHDKHSTCRGTCSEITDMNRLKLKEEQR